MPSMKAIKRRRLTVKNISQITKAMNLVATSKLQRARANKAAVGKPVQATFDIVYNTVGDERALEQPFVKPRAVKRTAYVLITSNRGLCGGYNSNVCKMLAKYVKDSDTQPVFLPLGNKGRDYFLRRIVAETRQPATWDEEGRYYDPSGKLRMIDAGTPSETPNFAEAKKAADKLISMYESGEIDEVKLVYTQFFTVLSLEPIIRQVLPVRPDYLRRVVGTDLKAGEEWEDLGFFPKPEAKGGAAMAQEVEFDSGIAEVLRNVVPWYLSMYLYAAMASSALCEQAARMTSMDSATKNAGDIIEKLTLMFNRQRQSIITQEITEIVSGANALQ
ncbi:MAG: F0F1 ATP synthase subunit gamma [Defluviitaleaceae bacterium]|nr:F0F1 ATP synthase subunit gamma [Defluviitaleaceae bacterium]MCL2262034.1 F0F1 ATP synthase subunit gamma [Defluviitaleaceae bacterium]